MTEKIICAAVLVRSTGAMYYGHRHSSAVKSMFDEGDGDADYIEGFVTTDGRFVNREAAMIIAIESGVLSHPQKRNVLFTTDIY